MLLIPWQSVRGIRMLDELVVRERDARASFYRSAIASQWVLALVTIAVLWNVSPDFVRGMFTATLTTDGFLVVGLAAVALLSQSPLLPFVHERMQRSEAIRQTLLPMRNILPRTAEEKTLWISVSLTAGICEEILFRGFLFYYGQTVIGLETVGAIALSTAVFAFGHLYQGPANMLRVAVIGAILGIVYAATHSLLYCMALHAFLDLGALKMGAYVPADEPGDLPAKNISGTNDL